MANLAVWGEEFDMHYYANSEMLIVRILERNGYVFSIPYYKNIESAISFVVKYCENNDIPSIFWFEEGKALADFQKATSDNFEPLLIRDNCEYIYLREDLANLKGKKYHSKRNHISAFSKKYNWQYEDLSEDNIQEILEISKQWYLEKKIDGASIDSEKKGIEILLSNAERFAVKGGLIRVDGKSVAFCLATPINNEVYDINIEKALPDFNGAYPVINNEFAKRLNCKYINREDDLGIEGLRKAKLSYKPEIILKKYLCIPKKLLKQSVELHRKTFGDDGDFAEKLVNSFFAENILYHYKNGKIVSQLFLIDCFLEEERCGYIYAAATDISERNKGYMGALIEKSKNIYSTLCLKPADKYLFDFYRKFGFKTAFYKQSFSTLEGNDLLQTQKVVCSEEYKKIKENLIGENVLIFSENAVKLILDEYYVVTSKTPQNEFLATYTIENGVLKIKELFSKIPYDNIVFSLLSKHGCISFTLDAYGENLDQPIGMIYPPREKNYYLGNAID